VRLVIQGIRVRAVPFAFGAVGAVAVFSCTKNIARPPVEEVPIRDPNELAPGPAGAASAPKTSGDKPDSRTDKAPSEKTAAPSSSAPTFSIPLRDEPAPAEPPHDKAFPPQADACRKDDDCAATNLALGGEFMCCTPCKPTAGTKAWVKKVEQVCAQKQRAGYRPRCAPWDCARADAECRSGKCVVK
jgi:hypothetical protein